MSELKTACMAPFGVIQEHAWSSEAFVLCGCNKADSQNYRHIVAKCEDMPNLGQANSLANAEMIATSLNSHADLVAALQLARAKIQHYYDTVIADGFEGPSVFDMAGFELLMQDADATLKKARGES